MLERRGISALSEIRLISGLNYSGSLRADRIATLPLKAPIPLRDTPAMPEEQRFPLVESDTFISIYATSVLVGDDGAALALDLVNNSSYVLLLTPSDPIMNGVACTLSTASTSIMTQLVKGKTIDEAKVIIENYFNMIDGQPYDEELLDEAVCMKNVGKQANRIKCATIGWNGLKQLLEEGEEQ